MIKYNLDKLIKVDCSDFRLASWYSYRKEKKCFGIVTQTEGVYDDVFDSFVGSNIPEHYTLKNNILYENPTVILHYQGGHSKEYCFESFEEATKFADEITAIGKWIS